MANNSDTVFESSPDHNEVDNDSSDSSDFSDCDITLLEHAEDVMQKIAPQKTKKIDTNDKKKQKTVDTKKAKVVPRKKQLKKAEIEEVIKYLETKESAITLKTIENIQSKEFWDCHSGYRKSLSQCISHPIFSSVTNSIVVDFKTLYLKNNKGSTKYDNLQLDWFHNSSKYLKSPDDQIKVCLEGTTNDVKDIKHFTSCIISNLHTIVFTLCCSEIVSFLKMKRSPNASHEYKPDEEFVLYKSHGWILYEMKKHLEKKSCTLTKVERASWIEIQSSLTTKDKKTLPPSLHHLDKGLHGGMTFPSDILLPFMNLADVTFKELSAEENCQKFGKNITEIIKLQMHAHVGLKCTFYTAVSQTCQDISEDMVDKVYKFWIEKFCNMRIKDTFITAAEKLEISAKDRITSKTQNLRDSLLTDHVK